MKRYIPHTISITALLIALGHVIWPNVKIDAVTLTLIAIAVLPWLGSVFKSIELPGGLKVEYQDLEKAQENAEKVGLLSAPEKKEEAAYLTAVAAQDPNLALAGLRIEIERRLRQIANRQGIDGERYGVGQLLRVLRSRGAISQQEDSVLSDLIGLLNRAVHGADVDARGAMGYRGRATNSCCA
jgi:hypothetical protein